MALRVVPCTVTAAREYIRKVHRHNAPPQGGLFAAACEDDGKLVGVAVAGRPVARALNDGWTYEVTRVGTDGTRNGCSILYGALRRAAKALGYLRGITYTLVEEGGASLRASGWQEDARIKGRSWTCPSRPRTDKHAIADRVRWVAYEVGWETRGGRILVDALAVPCRAQEGQLQLG